MSPSFVIPNGVRQRMLNFLLQAWFRGYSLHLFVAPAIISRTLKVADMVEATFPGYAPLLPGGWPFPYLNVQKDAQSDFNPATWVVSTSFAGQSILGYYLADVNDLVDVYLNEGGPVYVRYAGDRVSCQGGVILMDTSECVPPGP